MSIAKGKIFLSFLIGIIFSISACLSPTLAARSITDLHVSVSPKKQYVYVGEGAEIEVFVTNNGPDVSRGAIIDATSSNFAFACDDIYEKIPVGETKSVRCIAATYPGSKPESYKIPVEAISKYDPYLRNNTKVVEVVLIKSRDSK